MAVLEFPPNFMEKPQWAQDSIIQQLKDHLQDGDSVVFWNFSTNEKIVITNIEQLQNTITNLRL